MSKTITAVATPYRSQNSIEDLEKEIAEMRGSTQNPNDSQQDSDTAEQNTPEDTKATSESEEELTYRKRYVDLKSHYDKEIFGARTKIKELEEKLDSSSKITPPKTQEELEEFKTMNPDTFAAMETMLLSKTGNSDATEARIRELEEQLTETKQREAMAEIQSVHPDFYEVVGSTQFEAWVKEQPVSVRNMVETNTEDSQSFIRVLDLYKMDSGITSKDTQPTEPKKVQKTDASAADVVVTAGTSGSDVGGTTERIWTSSEIQNMSMQEYEHFEDEILQARREGRVRNI